MLNILALSGPVFTGPVFRDARVIPDLIGDDGIESGVTGGDVSTAY